MMNTDTMPMRSGEDLDKSAISRYLHETVGLDPGEVRITQFPAGASNLTYLISAGREEFVLRRPPFGNAVRSAHDMRREHDVLAKLSLVYPLAPKPIVFCPDESVIGAEFYLMERRRGLVVRGRLPEVIERSEELQLDVCRQFIGKLADLHAIDYAKAGLSGLGHPEGYNRRQVEGWANRYAAAKTHEHSALEAVIGWLKSNIAEESAATLVHNDYKFDNIMLDHNDPTWITAVLDWEMVTVGDPMMDLGTTLGYWMSADAGEEMMNMPFNPRSLMRKVSRSELVEMYAERSGREIPDPLFYHAFGTFKIAVIAQQIFARYKKGFTKDARFAGFDRLVETLGNIALNAIERGSI